MKNKRFTYAERQALSIAHVRHELTAWPDNTASFNLRKLDYSGVHGGNDINDVINAYNQEVKR